MAVYLNGKFSAQLTTGVQRVAGRLVQALDAQLEGTTPWVLLCPPGGRPPPLQHIELRTVGRPGQPLHLWEQVTLPWAARDGLLVNLAGSAPYFARRQAALLHDAAVFDRPDAYTASFVSWYSLLFRRLARRAEKLFTVSAFSRERLALHLHIDPGRIDVLPNGCDHLDDVGADETVLARHGLQGKRFLLAVASANPTKNLAALVAAFERLPADPMLRLVIVGCRNERVFSKGDATADPPNVVRTGPLDDPSLKALYRHATALVFPSLYEGFGLPPLEAMACGCPVAVARAASMPEVCGESAVYFDPRSVEDIAGALERLLGDDALCGRLRASGCQRAAAFRWGAAGTLLLQRVRDVA